MELRNGKRKVRYSHSSFIKGRLQDERKPGEQGSEVSHLPALTVSNLLNVGFFLLPGWFRGEATLHLLLNRLLSCPDDTHLKKNKQYRERSRSHKPPPRGKPIHDLVLRPPCSLVLSFTQVLEKLVKLTCLETTAVIIRNHAAFIGPSTPGSSSCPNSAHSVLGLVCLHSLLPSASPNRKLGSHLCNLKFSSSHIIH